MSSADFIREVGPVQWVFRTAVRQFHKRISKTEHRMRLPTGTWFGLPFSSSFASEAYVTGGNVDWGSEELFSKCMDPRGTFLDVGANIGYYSLYMAPRVSTVYCFEPDPRALKLLEKNVSAVTTITIVPCAVGAEPGFAQFTLEDSSECSHVVMNGAAKAGQRGQIEVPIVTIDQFVEEHQLQISAIKIDAEGYDLHVVRGAAKTLAQQGPILLVEREPDTELFDALMPLDYSVFAFVRDTKTRACEFAELHASVPAGGDTKMLFLVPRRLHSHFATQITRH